MLEVRKRFLKGQSSLTDRREKFLTQCSRTGSVETKNTYRRHLERFRTYLRLRAGLSPKEQTNECLLAPGDPEAVIDFSNGLGVKTQTLDATGTKPLLSEGTYNANIMP